MNEDLQEFARSTLLERLAQCTEEQNFRFKRMYSPDDLTLDIEAVVENMPVEDLSRAMDQLKRTIIKNSR